jgi:hypothetical protein
MSRLAACALTLLLAGCGGTTHAPAAPRGDGVRELRSIGQLRTAFDAHPGVPRLIVLASPT